MAQGPEVKGSNPGGLQNTVTEISRFFDFQDGGHPPPWICCARVWITHEDHLVVFIVVQSLVEINAVVLIMFFDRANLA